MGQQLRRGVLGLQVMAEGVETEARRLARVALGCPAYQAYLFSRPLPGVDFEARVQQTQTAALE